MISTGGLTQPEWSPCINLASFQVIEQHDELYALPRAVHFDDETMRVFQACGLADEVVKTTKLNKGMKFVDKVSFSKYPAIQINVC